MCQELDSLRQSVIAYARRFDARSLTPAQAGAVVAVCAQVEASMASIKALAGARSAEGHEWQEEGYRSPADHLAHRTGMSPSAARRALDTGRRLAEQPDVAAAALGGELSAEQACAVTDGAAADPTRTRDLVEKARTSSIAELNEEVTRIKAAVTDQEARRRAIHARRSLRRWTDTDGALQVRMYGHPEDGARLWRVLDPLRRRLNLIRRGSGPNEPLDALDYDAIMAMASVAAGHDGELGMADLLDLGLFPQLDTALLSKPDEPSRLAGGSAGTATSPGGSRSKKLAGSPARLMIRVDLETLMRGVPIQGELCEIAGYGPVPVSVIEDLVANENPFIVGILTQAERVIGVYHHRRRPSAHQKSALDFLYPACAVEGCSARAGLQYDHREDWARTKFTVFDLLDRLCAHHHALKTRQGWELVPGSGKRAFVAPGDPRHPGRSRRSGKAGPAPPFRS